jgi:hypothetical protein
MVHKLRQTWFVLASGSAANAINHSKQSIWRGELSRFIRHFFARSHFPCRPLLFEQTIKGHGARASGRALLECDAPPLAAEIGPLHSLSSSVTEQFAGWSRRLVFLTRKHAAAEAALSPGLNQADS